jgi:preprotein translocase subunit SecF
MTLRVTQQHNLWWGISSTIIVIGLVAMLISWQQIGAPLRPSLDFVGGTRLQLELDCTKSGNCDRPIDIAKVRTVMESQGLANSGIQVVGQEQQGLSLRTKTLDVDTRTQLVKSLSEHIGVFDPKATQIDTVGPAIGQQIFSSGLLALIISFAGIIIYLSLRFQFDYAFFAVVALFHDVLITAGIFAILGLSPLQTEVDSLFLVAMLTIVGFSVNDTVVIYDRIRETIKLNPGDPINQIVDDAVNQTMTRSINTTLTVLLSLFAILIFGGETLKNFSLALIIGFTMGAYSSIFIASTLLAWWRVRQGQTTFSPAVIAAESTDAVSEAQDTP